MKVRRCNWHFLTQVLIGGLIQMVIAGQPISAAASDWPAAMEIVQTVSTIDGTTQPAYFYPARGKAPRPLVVSLHTWSGNYSQQDTLALLALQQNWNFIHPNFRGPNRTPAACLSDTALQDIDDAIDYALAHAPCDANNIFIIGVSGGGYATLGMYMRSTHHIKAFSAWASISDLEAWYYESQVRQNKYANDILGCLALNSRFDPGAARARSPLY